MIGILGYMQKIEPGKWKATVPDLGMFSFGEEPQAALERLETALQQLEPKHELKTIDPTTFFVDIKRSKVT